MKKSKGNFLIIFSFVLIFLTSLSWAEPPPRVVDLPNRYLSGLYVSENLPSPESLIFRVRGNNLEDLRFSIHVKCVEDATGVQQDPLFTSHSASPRSSIPDIPLPPGVTRGPDTATPQILLDAYGKADARGVPVTDSGRNLKMHLTVHVQPDGRATASISLRSDDLRANEFCTAERNLTLRKVN